MKKTYINPTIEVVKIASQMQMLAGSLDITGNPAGKDGEGYYNDARYYDFDDEEY